MERFLSLRELSGQEMNDYFYTLKEKVEKYGYSKLSTYEFFILTKILSYMSHEELINTGLFSQKTLLFLQYLRKNNIFTHARIGVALLYEILTKNTLEFYELDRSVVNDFPVVVFVSIKGTQVPISKSTLGSQFRHKRNIQPPVGPYFTAGLFYFFGLNARVFNLSLGVDEFNEMINFIKSNKDRVWFLSFNSNFLGPTEINSLYYVYDEIHKIDRKYHPRFIGGGPGMLFYKDFILKNTPIEIVLDKNGGETIVDMVLSTGYSGPYDESDNWSLFKRLPNLNIVDGDNIHSTKYLSYTDIERKVMANRIFYKRFDVRKYWKRDLELDVCVPDDLNVELENENKSTISASSEDLHLENYIHKLKGAKLMTTFGNCNRGCKFCQYTSYGVKPYFLNHSEITAQITSIIKYFPRVELFILENDNLGLSKKHMEDVINSLKENKDIIAGRVFMAETVAINIDAKILRQLHRYGFREILFGIESTVEHIVRDSGKLHNGESFDQFIKTPYVAYDQGLSTRVTSILFYPTISEHEIAKAINGLLDFMNYGIRVAVFPLVKALPGTFFLKHHVFEISKTKYIFKDNNRKVIFEIPQNVLPLDKTALELSLIPPEHIEMEIKKTIEENQITSDYHPSLNVICYFKAVTNAWKKLNDRTTSDFEIEQIDYNIDIIKKQIVKRNFIGQAVKKAVLHGNIDYIGMYLRKEDNFKWINKYLKTMIDFGNKQEVFKALHLLQIIISNFPGLLDESLMESVEYAARRFEGSERASIDKIIGSLK